MAAVRVGINGFGRIGRNVFRACLGETGLDIVALNDITDAATLAHLLKYDSVHGRLDGTVTHGEGSLTVNGKSIKVTAERDPGNLPWKELKVDVVLECSGIFTARDQAAKHLSAGAKKVLISAPAKGADLTVCFGVNEKSYDPAKHDVVSNASCTTNCLAPVAKVLHETFGIKRGLMTTIHSYTNDQRILDLPHEDLRRARAAALSMIPTTTGAAKAVALVLPALEGKLDGMAVRVPTPNVSLVDLTAELDKKATEKDINAAMKKAAEGELKGVLQYCDEPLVSSDFNGTAFSSIFDSELTRVIDGTFIKVLSWYDNEWGFSNRMRDVALLMGRGLR
ncbi:MAG: type I glyceraldehyde-3-phosphate dehydrogenase [Candidatus Binatia bacterium]